MLKVILSCFVFLLVFLIFSVVWWNDTGLAGTHITAIRFAFLQMMVIAASAGVIVAWIVRRHFRFCLLDVWILLYAGYVWNRFLLGGMVEYRVRLLILLVVLYFLFRILSVTGNRALYVMQSVFLSVVTVEGVYGFCQLYGWVVPGHSLFRLTGSFFNPGPYSGFLAVGLVMALDRILSYREYGLFKRWPGSWKKGVLQAELLLAWICLSVVVIVLPAGMSRGAWVAALAGCGTVVWLRGGKQRIREWIAGNRKRAFTVGVITGLLFAVIFAGVYSLKKDSADGRILIWKISLLAMREHPWMGVGMGRFGSAYGQAQAAYFASGSATGQEENVAGVPEYGFNEYLQQGVELGIIGLVVFLAGIVMALWQLFRFRRKGWVGITGGWVSMLVFACFSYPLSVLPLCLVFMFLLALSGPPAGRFPQAAPWGVVVLACAGLVLTGIQIPRNREIREAYAAWRDEQVYYNMKIYEGTVDNYARLYPLLKEDARFLFEYGQCLSKTGEYAGSTRILIEALGYSADPMFYNILGKNAGALGDYTRAEHYFRQAACILPNRLYPLYLLACLYFDTGQYEKAREISFQFLQKEPKVMSAAIREMKEDIRNRINITGDHGSAELHLD